MAEIYRAVWVCLVVAGCAHETRVPQPRAQITAPVNPLCLFLCNSAVELLDSEGARIQGATGTVTITRPQTGGAQTIREVIGGGPPQQER